MGFVFFKGFVHILLSFEFNVGFSRRSAFSGKCQMNTFLFIFETDIGEKIDDFVYCGWPIKTKKIVDYSIWLK